MFAHKRQPLPAEAASAIVLGVGHAAAVVHQAEGQRPGGVVSPGRLEGTGSGRPSLDRWLRICRILNEAITDRIVLSQNDHAQPVVSACHYMSVHNIILLASCKIVNHRPRKIESLT